MVKKIIKGLVGFIVLVLVAILVIPFVVDVDKYRPEIVKAANEHIHGKLDLGKLKLSLWGQIRVEIEGVKLDDRSGNTIVKVKDAWFHVPFSSIFGGSPILTFVMKSPELSVIKDKAGKLNVMTLVKEKPKTAEGAGAPSGGEASDKAKGEAPKSESAKTEIPEIARNARLGIRIETAKLLYKDATQGLTSQIDDLNLVVKDLSLSRPTEVELWANLATKMGTISVNGPAKASLRSELVGGALDHIAMSFAIDLDDLEILIPGAFEKKKGVTARFDAKIDSTPNVAKIESMAVKFFNAEIKAQGGAENLKGASPLIKFQAKSNEISLKEWKDLIPALKEGELTGVAAFDAKADGPSDKLNYAAKFSIDNLTMKSPGLKSKPQFDLAVSVVTDKVDNLSFVMKAPGNDLKIKGDLESFTAPKLTLAVTSTGMDLDQLVDFPPPAKDAAKDGGKDAGKADKGAKSADAGAAGGKSSDSKAPAADFDAMLDPLRQNKMAATASAFINIDMAFIKAMGMKLSDIKSKITFKDLVAAIDNFSLKLWDGTIKMGARTNLKPKAPTYEFKADLAGLMLQQAVTSQMQLLKNTVVGKAFFKMDGSGVSFNPDPATKNLKAKGSMKIENAKFASIDVGKMTSEAVNSALGKIGDKIPQAKGKSVSIPNRESKYEYISSDFSIEGGKFSAPNFKAKAAVNDGIDLEGATTLGLIDYSLSARWLVIDTYNFTKARDISVEQAGTRVDAILAEGNGPVKFPVSVTGTAMAPVYQYGEVPEYLTKVALGKVSGAAQNRAKQEAQKQLEQLQKKAPEPAQKAIQGIQKKLFGR